MKQENISSIVESILFVSGEPVALRKICAAASASASEVRAAMNALKDEYLKESRGVVILEKDDSFQMTANPKNASFVRALVQREGNEKLSPAILETLSVVVYRGRVTRVEVDAIRGVNSASALRSLAIRGLVDRTESKEDSRIFIYAPSFLLLRLLGIESFDQLPQYAELSRHPRIQKLSEATEKA